MSELFATQPYAFPSFDGFTTIMSNEQQAQLFGQTLDSGFERHIQQEPHQSNDHSIANHFFKRDQQYIRFPARSPAAIKIHESNLGVYQEAHTQYGAAENANSMITSNGGFGKAQGSYVVSLLKAALAIASHASEAQVDREAGQQMTKKGVLRTAFPQLERQANSGEILAALGRFMEPTDMRQMLQDVAIVDPRGGNRTADTHTITMQSLAPGNSLNDQKLWAMKQAGNHDESINASVARSTPMNMVRSVRRDQAHSNGFKPYRSSHESARFAAE